MKTNFITFEDVVGTHYLRPLGETVCIGACDDADELLADGYVDVFTGELYGKSGNSITRATPTYAQTWKINEHKVDKKALRRARIDRMCGIHWDKNGMKVQGANRMLRRRMMPNAEMMAKFDGFLPF